jgi:hypothetical protein
MLLIARHNLEEGAVLPRDSVNFFQLFFLFQGNVLLLQHNVCSVSSLRELDGSIEGSLLFSFFQQQPFTVHPTMGLFGGIFCCSLSLGCSHLQC